MNRRSFTAILLAILFVAVVLWVRHRGVHEPAPAPPIAPPTRPASAPASTGPSWVGFAGSRKAGPYLSGADVYVDLPGDRWPPEIEGKRIVVSGTAVVRYDLPYNETICQARSFWIFPNHLKPSGC
jgi:hypothetical protein